ASREKALGPAHPDVAQSLGNLAQLYLDLGQYPKAESLVKRSLAIGEKALGPDHPDVALSLSNLGAAYSGQGRFTQAEPLLKRALAIGEKVLGPDHVDVALFLSNLGAVYLQQGRFPQAEPVLKRALAIGEKALGPDHPEVAQSLGNLAISYDAQGQFDDAEPLLRRALSISEKALGSDHPDVAMYLSNLACLYVKQGRYSEADSLLGQALYRDVKTLGLAHPRMAGALTNLAVSYSTQGMYSVAGYLHEKALAIFEKALGPDHPYVAMALTNLAGLHLAGEEVREAEPLLRRALVIHVKALGPDHPHVAKSLEGLAVLEASLDRRRSALPLLQRALAIDELTIDNVFSLASERQKFEFLGTVANRLDMLLTLVVHQVPNNPVARQLPDNAEHLRRAADAVLRRKGLVLDALSMERTALLTSEDPEFGEAARRLHATASTLATMVLAGPAEMEAGAYRSRIDELQDERDGLEGQLAGLSMIYAARRQDHQVDASQVAAAIEPGAILVEYVRYRPWNFATPGIWMKWATPRYLTFVLGARHAAVPLLVDPGEAEPIDKAVHAFRQKMERSAVTIGRVGEAESERLLAERGRRLYDLVLAPLRASIGDAETIYLAPDGELNQIPFGVLQDEHGRYLSESYQLNYLSSGRDLLRLGPNRPPGSIVVVADPNYDLRRQEDDAGAPGDERPGPSEPESVPRSADLRSSGWARLPGTRAEAEGISMTLSGLGIDLFAGDGASEQVVKETRTPRVLHLATHGFFLEDQDRSDWLESAQSQRGLVLDGVSGLPHLPQLALENPLLRSGLVFAGANHLGKRPLDEGEDDGILTALEVSGMNLWGTDLVVLSACETGLGEVRTGEGVFGLRRAFQLAGARTVVMSLWSVPDEETVTLMTDFYRRMNAGVGKARALQEASLALMRERREKHGAAHPYYWGAFVSVGEP
ncbi:MAG: CHAT domain-containing protein, partial [Candidatus Latescibacteria bacterium]|nr:CHAT domain-containing protein [Candidatus Latescibacterota bacterium]